MKVRRNAWHYRLYNFLHTVGDDGPEAAWEIMRKRKKVRQYQPSSLCKYFWFCVTLTFLFAILGLLAVGASILMLILLYGIVVPFEKIRDRVRAREAANRAANPEKYKDEVVKEPKEPGLIRSFIKAKKNKVCPLIEIVD